MACLSTPIADNTGHRGPVEYGARSDLNEYRLNPDSLSGGIATRSDHVSRQAGLASPSHSRGPTPNPLAVGLSSGQPPPP